MQSDLLDFTTKNFVVSKIFYTFVAKVSKRTVQDALHDLGHRLSSIILI